ncbi:hypothetical protein C2S52_006679 [Perilla frutescens var. hirtella]|nr:hypothetical protein C2S51_009034 [Perilla frutescens var. frutescens]KAH6787127.1 hypothetical protein C2S52_006679 [Perilla frutescens var. hirtella]
MKSFVRISALMWADILVAYALFVMTNYLTDVWKLSVTHAAGIVNIWGGISMILPVFFLFLVDSLLGNFTMLVISSMAYSVGIGFVTMSTPPVLAKSTGTCKQYEPGCIGRTQKVLFYTGMALIAVGTAGNLVSVKPFLEEQEEVQNNASRGNNSATIDIWKLPAFIIVVIVPVVGAIALPYIKPWSLRFGIPAICTLVAAVLFLTGWFTYNKVKPKGSPITTVCRVFVAAASKKSQIISNETKLCDDQENDTMHHQSFSRTRFLRCLEKAAIILPNQTHEEQRLNRWRLCSVIVVKAAKIALRMVPMWTTFIVCGIISSTAKTYFIEQADQMNRRLGSWEVPLQVLLLLSGWAKQFFKLFADCLLKKSKTYAPPVGIAVAMIFSILCCITAARIEIRRLRVIRDHGLLDKPDEDIPMSVFWLLFQFFLLAGLDSFFEKSVAAFYNDQSPECMKNYLDFFTKGVSGLGFMSSVLSVYVVGKISERGGKSANWFQYTLNRSRLDRYYWVLAGLSSVNLLVFVLASCYRYKNWAAVQNEEEADAGAGAGAAGAEEGYLCCFC